MVEIKIALAGLTYVIMCLDLKRTCVNFLMTGWPELVLSPSSFMGSLSAILLSLCLEGEEYQEDFGEHHEGQMQVCTCYIHEIKNRKHAFCRKKGKP